MALTTVPACKAFRGIPGDNREHDAELARLIDAVQAFLELECERTFEQATVTEYFHGDDWRDLLIVARPPLISITNLWDDPLRVYATPLAASGYVMDDAEAGIIRLDGITFSKGIRNIKLTYVGGFATIPTDLEQAAIELVWAAREKGVNNLVGVRSRSVADGNVQYVNLGWGSLVDDIVSQYRLHTGVA
jgi:hypothetical protein